MSVDKVAAFAEILALDPGNAFARYGLAIEYTQRGETGLAMEQFDTLQKLHPDYTAGYQMAAQLLIKAGRFSDARERLEAGIAAARRTANALALNEMGAMLDDLSA